MTDIKSWIVGVASGAMLITGVIGLSSSQKAEQRLQQFKAQPYVAQAVVQAGELTSCKESLHLYKTEVAALQDDLTSVRKMYHDDVAELEDTKKSYGAALQVCSQKLRSRGVVK